MDSDNDHRRRQCSTNAALLDPTRFGWTASGGVAELLHPRRRTQTKLTKKSTNPSRTSKKRSRREAFSNSNVELPESVDPSFSSPYHKMNGLSSFNLQTSASQSTGTWTQKSVDVVTSHDLVDDCAIPSGAETVVTEAMHCVSFGTAQTTKELHDTESVMTMKPANEYSDYTLSTRNSRNHDRALNDESAIDIFHYDQTFQMFELNESHGGDLSSQNSSLQVRQSAEIDQSMVATVTIQFPLEDEIDEEDGRCRENRFYHYEKQWDLSSEDTLSPMEFATQLAREFGLSYAQTWDLVESIQTQLQGFVNDNFSQTVPSLQNKDHQAAVCVPLVPSLYGEATGYLQEGGSCHPLAPKPKEPPLTRIVAPTGFSTTTQSCDKLPPKRRNSIQVQKVEYQYYNQVRERLHRLLADEVRSTRCASITLREKHACHLCLDSQPLCGIFACGLPSHSYCMHHLSERLGLKSPAELQHVEHCPICTLSCTCVNCESKLDSTAFAFKAQCLAQKASPEHAVFDDLLGHCRSVNIPCDVKRSTSGEARKVRKGPRQAAVQKLPPSEFPKEFINDVDVDMGFETEYRTVFTSRGWFLLSSSSSTDTNKGPISPSSRSQEVAPMEDGSVDFCNVCKKVGDLLCCDLCPRAFHSECLPSKANQTDSVIESQWECPSCCQEKIGLDADKIDGSCAIARVRLVFTGEHHNEEHLTLLSILHEMIDALIDFDFGYMFQSPVDLWDCPTYATVVKNPMDLGTIRTNLLKTSISNGQGTIALEERALATLKDMELVWHNCLIFNVEGSAVYRMAEVQMRRAESIRKRSFDHLLSEHIKQELATYASTLASEREEYRRLEPPPLKRKNMSLPPLAICNIGGLGKVMRGRPVAVFDQETGRIVKMYSSLHSSVNAVKRILGLDRHECEWDSSLINTDSRLRTLIKKSQEDPSIRLFGYRWIYWDVLQSGETVMLEDNTICEVDDDPQMFGVEMVDNGLSYFFNSIAEALSFPDLSCEIPDLFARLKVLVPGAGPKQIAGRSWLLRSTPRCHSASLDRENDVTSDVSTLPGVEIVREDVVFGSSQLVGFPHVKAAYQDWCHAVDTSVTPITEPKSVDTFVGVFLDSKRTVDGMTWRRVSPSQCEGNLSHPRVDLLGAVSKLDTLKSTVDEAQTSGEPGLAKDIRNASVESSCTASLTGSQLDTPSKTSHPTENSRSSMVFDLEAVLSPKQSFQLPNVTQTAVLNGLSENCHMGLHVSPRDDGIEVVVRRDATTLG